MTLDPKRRIFKTGRKPAPYKAVPANLPDPNTGQLVKIKPKQRAIVRALETSGSVAEAARIAGASNVYAHNTFKLPAVQQYLKEQLEAAGVTHGKIMQRIAEGLDATERKEYLTKAGQLLQGQERPDYQERREHVKLALRLQGLDAAATEEGNNISSQSIYNIVINARVARGLEEPTAPRLQDGASVQAALLLPPSEVEEKPL